MPLALDASGVSTTNLVAYYKFESGAITTDSSGNGYTLTNNGTVTSVAGLYGNCANLATPNSTQWLSIASGGLGTDLSGAFSVNLWVKLQAQPSSEVWEFIRWESTTGTARYLQIYYQQFAGDGAGNYRLAANNSEGYSQVIAGEVNALGDGNWHMITAVATGTVISLYLEGKKVAVATRGTTITATSRIRIGADNVNAQYSDAYFDDVSFWSRALTDDEIGALADLVPPSVILV